MNTGDRVRYSDRILREPEVSEATRNLRGTVAEVISRAGGHDLIYVLWDNGRRSACLPASLTAIQERSV